MTRWPALLLCLLLGKGAADDNASNASENATFDNASASESATVPLCLQGSGFEAVPKDQRRFIRDNQGQDLPLGLLLGNWPSSELLTEITLILLEEVLGFHAEIQEARASFGASPIWALAGCLNFDDRFDKMCGEEETKYHISVDSWIGSYQKEFDEMRDAFPATVPLNLGSMGYAGEESVYITEADFKRAYSATGLALDFYRSYNTTYHDPKQYFDSIQDIPRSELAFCNQTDMSNPQRMGFYEQHSGDPDGVVQQPDGSYFAYCPDDIWWISPACRQDTSKCIPTLTASVGWRLQAIMQWVTAYGIPAAVAIISDFSTWVQRVRQVRALFYWWVPDSTFIDLQPLQIIFPRHSASAWALGDKKTSGAGSLVAKMVSSNLASKSSSVQAFVSKIHFELSQVQSLLLDMSRSSAHEVACDWIRKEQDVWLNWLPVETNCFQGFGMVNEDGAFLESRVGAVSCGLCPAGRFSEETADSRGKTYRCTLCPPGFSQSKTFSTICEECPKGTYSNTPGSEACTLCEFGKYQNLTAQSSCVECGLHKTTLLPASISADKCVCQEGRVEDESDASSFCTPCMKGLACPRGSTRTALLLSNGTDEESRLLAGYNSDPSSPFRVYKCPNSNMCPGGKPGNCPGSLYGRTCAECGENRYRASTECLECGTGVKVMWVLIGVFFCAVILSTHILATNSYTHKATSLLCITSGVGMLVVLFQNLGVLHTISIPWPDGLNQFLRFASLFLFRLEGLGLSCFTWNNVVWEYAAITAIFWVLLVALPVIGICTKMIPCFVQRGWAWNVFKAFSTVGQFLQVGFTTMTSLSMTPFMCYRHPTQEESILKYPDIFCGSPEHTTMKVFGSLLIAMASTFLVGCCYAAVKAPGWSGTSKLTAVRFLVVRFRPDVWWFGLILLFRGLLLSVPAVIVTDMPSIHLALMLIVLLTGLCLQTFFLPWKAPVLNLVDALSNGCFVALLSVSLAFLEVDSREAYDVLQSVAIFFSISMVLILVFMIVLSLMGLVYSNAMGNHQDSMLFNLGKAPDPREVFRILMDIAQYVEEEASEKEKELVNNLENFSVYDLDSVMRAMNILADDLEMVVNMEKTFGARINSGQRSIRPTQMLADGVYLQRLSVQNRGSLASNVSKRASALRKSVEVKRASRMSLATLATETGPWRTSTYPVDEADMKEETEENENIGPGPVQVELQQPVQDVDNPEEIVQVEFATRPRWQL